MSEQSTPPKGLPSSPSIFAYQTRLLQRTSSTTNNPSPHKTGSTSGSGFSSLAAMAKGSSPPSTPIRRNVARMIANPPEQDRVGLGIGMDRPGHRAGRSVDLVRGWEDKISKSNDSIANPSPTKGSGSIHVRQSGNSMPPPPLPATTSSSSSLASDRSSPFLASSCRASIDTPSTPHSITNSRMEKRNTVSGMDGSDASKIPDTPEYESTFRARPASVSSYTSILSPHSTGDSSIASSRSQATEDRLANAKANALKRREAKAAASGQVDTVKAVETIKAISTPAAEVAEAVLTVKSIPSTPVKESPFANVFDKPTDDEITPKRSVPNRNTPTSSHMSARNIFEQPDLPKPSGPSSTKSKGIPSGLSLGQPSVPSGLAPAPSSDKYGSISKTDRRRLGRHLPRIASGGEGWEGDDTPAPASAHARVPSKLGRQAPPSPKEENIPPPSPSKSTYTSISAPTRPRPAEVLAPIKSTNVPSTPTSAPSTVSKRRSVYGSAAKPELPSHVGVNSPRPEVAGEDMKGLMSAVGAMSLRNAPKDSADGVTGQFLITSKSES